MRALLDELDDRSRRMLIARQRSDGPRPYNDIAKALGVVPVWVARHLPRAEARFAELLDDPVHAEVREQALQLAGRLGPYLPAGTVLSELQRLGMDPHSDEAQVLLHVAGPYLHRGDWFEAEYGAQRAAAAVDEAFDRNPAPTSEALLHALAGIGMPLFAAAAYVRSREDWRSFGNVWVRWGDSAFTQIEAVLHARNCPARPEEISAALGDGVSLDRIRGALSADSRFIRATRRTWGLRIWDLPEYAGISGEIGARIDAAGGRINARELTAMLRVELPDVAESSIRTHITDSLAFINDGTTVRRRTADDEWPVVPPLRAARGAYRNGANEIRLAMPVKPDMLRGSGLSLHPAVAEALGISPDERRKFDSAQGPVVVLWRLASTNGPAIGSLRAQARAVNAQISDTLLLIFNLDHTSLTVQRLGADVTGLARLRRLLGRPVRSPEAALATSLDCPREELATVLLRRGDNDIAALITSA
ncbi:hypothetical protein I549_4306 [Mycobacterium avium subsp. avium 2285 (R)]|nr:hypothetical protein I549_4306 [Mycobacterium avium subsp. avium 2285 (R)]